MRRTLPFLLLLCLCLLAGCASSAAGMPAPTAVGVPAYALLRNGLLQDDALAATGESLYFFHSTTKQGAPRGFLYAMNQQGEMEIVCTKSGCTHEDARNLTDPCNAFSPLYTRGLMAYDGALYAGRPRSGQGIQRIDPETGERSLLYEPEKEMACFLLYSGSLYFAQQNQPTPQSAPDAAPGFSILKLPLDDLTAEPQAVYERKDAVGLVDSMQVLGSHLYFITGTADSAWTLLRVPLTGGDAQQVASDIWPHGLSAIDGKLALSMRTADGRWQAGLSEIDGSAFIPFATADEPLVCFASGTCVYVDTLRPMPPAPRTLRVFSAKGEATASVELNETMGTPLGADENGPLYWSVPYPEGFPIVLEHVIIAR